MMPPPRLGYRWSRSSFAATRQGSKSIYETQIESRGAGSRRAARDMSIGTNRTFLVRRSRSLSPPTFSFFEPAQKSDQPIHKIKPRFPGTAGNLPVISRDQPWAVNQLTNPLRRLFEKVSNTATANSQKRVIWALFMRGIKVSWRVHRGKYCLENFSSTSMTSRANQHAYTTNQVEERRDSGRKQSVFMMALRQCF